MLVHHYFEISFDQTKCLYNFLVRKQVLMNLSYFVNIKNYIQKILIKNLHFLVFLH